METSQAVGALSALAHHGRLSIFRLLIEAGPSGYAAGEISRRLDLQPSTASASLTILSTAGLVRSKRDGRSIIYSADYTRMANLLGFLMKDCCAGNPEICQPAAMIAHEAACCATPEATA